MEECYISLIIIAVVIIGFVIAPLIPHLIRKWDFKHQVKGRKPETKIKDDDTVPYYNKEDLGRKSERDIVDNIRRPPF